MIERDKQNDKRPDIYELKNSDLSDYDPTLDTFAYEKVKITKYDFFDLEMIHEADKVKKWKKKFLMSENYHYLKL